MKNHDRLSYLPIVGELGLEDLDNLLSGHLLNLLIVKFNFKEVLSTTVGWRLYFVCINYVIIEQSYL